MTLYVRVYDITCTCACVCCEGSCYTRGRLQAKATVGGKCTKEGGMQAEVGTNAESFNEFE